jgi:UDP-N-acetyl-D-mannosaminuronic acid dehydrogenase/UDP-N-acetyl-D-glucosamine dehydrogenase
MNTETGRKLVVMGQGYVGIPLAMRAVEAGFQVVGFDVDKTRIDCLARGETFIEDVTDSDVMEALLTGNYLPTSDPAALAGFDVAVVSVPTPLRFGAPDLEAVKRAAAELGQHLTPGCCVILESTTYPGTTEEVFVPALQTDGTLVAGQDFHVSYSPERIDPGNPRWRFRSTPKLVSGLRECCTRAALAFYRGIVDRVVPVAGIREAEAAKLLENTFRNVNIALVNEFAMCCHGLGIDVWEVIDAASTKPFGFMRFNPGPGVGGHCLPVDPTYLAWEVERDAGRQFRCVDIANDINQHMPQYVVHRAIAHLNRHQKSINGSAVLLLGLAYKPNSGDLRESPAIEVAKLLAELGAKVRAVDPLVDPANVPTYVDLIVPTGEDLARADLVIVLTDHDDIDWSLVVSNEDRILDTRNKLRHLAVNRL